MSSDDFSFKESAEYSRPLVAEKKVNSLSTSSGQDFKENLNDANDDYLSDIKPLEFSIKRRKDRGKHNQAKATVVNESINNDRAARKTKSQVQAQLHGNTFSQTKRKHIFDEINLFNNIDMRQFEQLLREPSHLQMVKKTKGIKQFRKLFLAQELQVPLDNDVNTTSLLDINSSHTLSPNVSITNDDDILESSTLHTHSHFVSPIYSPRSSTEQLAYNSNDINNSNNKKSTSKAIWTTKFSGDGKFLATGGRDCTVVIWKVLSTPVERISVRSGNHSTNDLRTKILRSQNISRSSASLENIHENMDHDSTKYLFAPVFDPKPYRLYKEHTHDVLSLDWSKNNFLLSSSMDNTVKLWHPEKSTSLKTFKHPDFVTSIAFHPTDDRFFISGCIDHKCRMWSILDHQVTNEFDCQDLITYVTFSPNDATYIVIGTFNGFVFLLSTHDLKPIYSFHITDTSTQKLQNSYIFPDQYKKYYHGPRITGIELFINDNDNSLRAVITCKDSRIRIFNLRTKKLVETLKGFHNKHSSHVAHISTSQMDDPIVISSSDNSWVYCWKLKSSVNEQQTNLVNGKDSESSGIGRSRSFKNIFSTISRSSSQKSLTEDRPRSLNFLTHSDDTISTSSSSTTLHSSIQSKYNNIKVSSLLHSSSSSSSSLSHSNSPVKNKNYVALKAHEYAVTTAIIAPTGSSKALSLSNDVLCELSLEFSCKSENRETINSSPAMNNILATSDAMFSTVKAIGTILITTDNRGIIRVFRSDLSSKLKSIVLKNLQDYKLEKGYHSMNTSKLLSSSIHRSNSLHSTLSNIVRPHSYNNMSNLHKNTINNDSILNPAVPKQPIFPKRSKSFTHVRHSLSALTPSNHSSSSRGSKFRGNNSSTSLVHSIESENSTSKYSLNGLECDVCKGTNFEYMKKDFTIISSQLDNDTLICKDCGTIFNNFR